MTLSHLASDRLLLALDLVAGWQLEKIKEQALSQYWETRQPLWDIQPTSYADNGNIRASENMGQHGLKAGILGKNPFFGV